MPRRIAGPRELSLIISEGFRRLTPEDQPQKQTRFRSAVKKIAFVGFFRAHIAPASSWNVRAAIPRIPPCLFCFAAVLLPIFCSALPRGNSSAMEPAAGF